MIHVEVRIQIMKEVLNTGQIFRPRCNELRSVSDISCQCKRGWIKRKMVKETKLYVVSSTNSITMCSGFFNCISCWNL